MVYAKKFKVMSNNGVVTFHNVTAQVKELLKWQNAEDSPWAAWVGAAACRA